MIRPLWIGVFLIVCYAVVGTIDHAAAEVSHLLMLENSMLPATFDECERASPDRGRPRRATSRQQRTNEPWHHRTCLWQ